MRKRIITGAAVALALLACNTSVSTENPPGLVVGHSNHKEWDKDESRFVKIYCITVEPDDKEKYKKNVSVCRRDNKDIQKLNPVGERYEP